MGKIGIKIAQPLFNASIAKILRKYEDVSISEVKQRVEQDAYLYECDYIDAKGIMTILKMKEELEQKGIISILYEHDQITDIAFLNNLLVSYAETAEQIEAEMDREALLLEQEGE